MRALSKVAVQGLWANLQRLSNIRSTRYTGETSLEGDHPEEIYFDWAATRPGVLALMGHTHKMVFEDIASAAALLERTERRIAKLEIRIKALRGTTDVTLYRAQLDRWRTRLRVATKTASGQRTLRTNYLTGCRSFNKGPVTGIEISDGDVRLVVRRPEVRETQRQAAAAELVEAAA